MHIGTWQSTTVPCLISIIMPVYNEKTLIMAKLVNLDELDCPSFEVICVDGGSNDGTWEVIEKVMDIVKACNPSQPNKVSQLNFGLTIAKGDIIVCTDVDGRTEKDALLKFRDAFQDPNVGVVGAWVYPYPIYWLENFYWFITNIIRRLTGHSVVGTCYAFRREVLKQFPEDVIADDIYISQVARKKGLRTIYTKAIKVMEFRVPRNFKEFVQYRLRRWRAYWKLHDLS